MKYPQTNIHGLRNLHYICIVELVEHQTKAQRSTVIVQTKSVHLDAPYQVNLRGTKTNCGKVLRDPDTGKESLFFVFNDLAVRTMGFYRLQAIIFDMDRYVWTGILFIISEYYDSIQYTKRSILFNNIYVGPLKMEQPYIPSRLKSNQPETMGQGLARQS